MDPNTVMVDMVDMVIITGSAGMAAITASTILTLAGMAVDSVAAAAFAGDSDITLVGNDLPATRLALAGGTRRPQAGVQIDRIE
jgi:hypothetical protein